MQESQEALRNANRDSGRRWKGNLAEAGCSSPDYRIRSSRCCRSTTPPPVHEIWYYSIEPFTISDHRRLVLRASSVDSDGSDDNDFCDGGLY